MGVSQCCVWQQDEPTMTGRRQRQTSRKRRRSTRASPGRWMSCTTSTITALA